MSLIFDTTDNPITSFAMTLESAEVAQFSIRIDCKVSNFLSNETVGDLLVEAKLSTDVMWTDIETTPLDLSTYAPSRQTFDIRLTAATVTVFTKKTFNLSVGP